MVHSGFSVSVIAAVLSTGGHDGAVPGKRYLAAKLLATVLAGDDADGGPFLAIPFVDGDATGSEGVAEFSKGNDGAIFGQSNSLTEVVSGAFAVEGLAHQLPFATFADSVNGDGSPLFILAVILLVGSVVRITTGYDGAVAG